MEHVAYATAILGSRDAMRASLDQRTTELLESITSTGVREPKLDVFAVAWPQNDTTNLLHEVFDMRRQISGSTKNKLKADEIMALDNSLLGGAGCPVRWVCAGHIVHVHWKNS